LTDRRKDRRKDRRTTTDAASSHKLLWSSTRCTRNKIYTFLYKIGFTGGSHYTQPGGAANYLCLPSDPSVGVKPASALYNIIYGAEFESNDFGPHAKDEDVPCAVCRSPMATSTLMIPARDTCYPGWTAAYR